jgi:uncharacterized protein (DUF1330 family)
LEEGASQWRELNHPASSRGERASALGVQYDPPAIKEGGGRFLARGNAAYAFENGKIERMAVIEFPSVEAAHAAHESAGYQEALAALDGGVSRDLRIVEGIE